MFRLELLAPRLLQGLETPGTVSCSSSPAALQAMESGWAKQRVFPPSFKSKAEAERAHPRS